MSNPVTNAHEGLKIDSYSSLLAGTVDRRVCSSCGKHRLYFCYDCVQYMDGVAKFCPKLELPCGVDIVKHRGEKNSKSTAIHAKLLAPHSTRLYRSFDEVPDYSSHSTELNLNIVVVYPEKDSITIEEFVRSRGPIDRFIILDATWYTVGGMRHLPQLRGIPRVRLHNYTTDYWRPQKGLSDEYLSSIEAIYYAVRENQHAVQPSARYNGEFDNLLFWFYFFREMVPEEKLKPVL